jgi:hypothetical protein
VLADVARRRPWLYDTLYRGSILLRSAPFLISRRDPSQYGEGKLLARFLPRGGYFLDIGCHEPIRCNNTWLLRRRGWRGWSVDASDFHRPLWRILRRRDRFLHAAAVSVRGVDRVGLYQFSPPESMFNTISADRVGDLDTLRPELRATVKIVPAVHITALLAEFATAWGRYPDILMTDVEGLDWSLIQAAGPAELRKAGVTFLLMEDWSGGAGTNAGSSADRSAPDVAEMARAGWSLLGRTKLSVLFSSQGQTGASGSVGGAERRGRDVGPLG